MTGNYIALTPRSGPLRDFGDIRMEAIALWAMFSLTLLSQVWGGLRYFAYLTPFIAVLAGLCDGRLFLRPMARPFVLLLVAGLVLSPLASKDGWKDMFFILSGISMSLTIREVRIFPRVLLGLFVLGTIGFAYTSGQLSAGFYWDFMNSASSFEGNFCFLFGLLAVYAAATRRWTIVVLATLGTLITLKRTVFGGVLLCVAIFLLPRRWTKVLIQPGPMISFNLLAVLTLLMYSSGQFEYFAVHYLGMSGNQFGMGRQVLYANVANQVLHDPWQFLFFGTGPGGAYESLGEMFKEGSAANLHSDVLKVFYEYGLLVYVGFLWLGYRMTDFRARMLFFFTNVVYFTDNTLIYHFYLFFLTYFAAAFETESSNKNGQTTKNASTDLSLDAA